MKILPLASAMVISIFSVPPCFASDTSGPDLRASDSEWSKECEVRKRATRDFAETTKEILDLSVAKREEQGEEFSEESYAHSMYWHERALARIELADDLCASYPETESSKLLKIERERLKSDVSMRFELIEEELGVLRVMVRRLIIEKILAAQRKADIEHY